MKKKMPQFLLLAVLLLAGRLLSFGNTVTPAYKAAAITHCLTCATPTGLYASNIGENDADVNWTAVGGASNYTLEYKEVSAGSWTTVGTFVFNVMNISSLSAGTKYDWRVRANCHGESSDWAYGQFATLNEGVPCGTAENLQDSPDCLASYVSWDAVPDAITYEVSYKKTSASTWTTWTVYGTDTVLTGSAGFYNWRVRVNCAGGVGDYANSTTTMMVISACWKKAPAIKEEAANGQLKLQPQPASTQVTLVYHAAVQSKAIITIHNQFGGVLLSRNVQLNEGSNKIPLDISSLRQGIYLIKLQAGEQVVSERLVVNK